jgi:ferritin-like metal-binding protein YciE
MIASPLPARQFHRRSNSTANGRWDDWRNTRSLNHSQSPTAEENVMVMNNLHDVLLDTIKDLYHAEKQLVKALPRMAKAANSEQLRSAIEEHLEVTEGQVQRLEQVFDELDLSPKAKVCHGMLGIVDEGKEVLEKHNGGNPAAIDAALIAAAQKVEHYEIAAYGSARTFAETLGLNRVAELLQETLNEEEETDAKLTQIAEGMVNEAAANEEGWQVAEQGESGRPQRRRGRSRKSTRAAAGGSARRR